MDSNPSNLPSNPFALLSKSIIFPKSKESVLSYTSSYYERSLFQSLRKKDIENQKNEVITITEIDNSLSKVSISNDKSNGPLIKDDNTAIIRNESTLYKLKKDLEAFYNKKGTSQFSETDISNLNDDDIFCTYNSLKGPYDVHVRDLKTLNDNVYINDIIINFYLQYLTKLFEKSQRSFYIFNTYFFPILSMGNSIDLNVPYVPSGTTIPKMKRKLNLLSYQYLIVPIFGGNHWSLSVIVYPDRIRNISNENYPVIVYLDSYYTFMHPCATILQKFLYYLVDEMKTVSIEYKEKISYIRKIRPEVPMQPNGTDCGVFMLHYIEKLLTNPSYLEDHIKDMNFNMKDWFNPVEACNKRKALKDLLTKIRMEGFTESLSP